MTQLRRIETGLDHLEIQPGDIVRLIQPFKPERFGSQDYAFGIVAGVVTDSNFHQSWDCQPGLDELVVYLYDPDSATTYVDQFGVKAWFSFDFDEVELH